MEIKKMTQAAMLSAAFVVVSITAIGMGLGYAGYIDFVVPVFAAVIYLKCGLRYSILSGITSLLFVAFALGNIPSSILMSQSIILGILCAILILKDESIFDDLFYGAVCAAFVMILLDINFSFLTNYSFIKEAQEYVDALNNIPSLSSLDDNAKDIIYYGSIATIPIGIIFITYFLSLIAGKKLRLLNKAALKKFTIIKNFKRYGGYMSCSKKTLTIGSIYFLISFFIEKMNVLNDYTYFMVILKSVQYIVLFFIIQDSFNFVNKFVFSMSRSRRMMLIGQFMIFICLVNSFTLTSIILIISNFAIERIFNVREKQSKTLEILLEDKL